LETTILTSQSKQNNEGIDKNEYLAFLLSGEEYAINIIGIKVVKYIYL